MPTSLSLTVTHLSSRRRGREEERAKEDKEGVREGLYIWPRFSSFCLQQLQYFIIVRGECMYYLVFWKSANSSGAQVMERKGMVRSFRTWSHPLLAGWPSAHKSLLWISASSRIKQRMSSKCSDLYEQTSLIVIQIRTSNCFQIYIYIYISQTEIYIYISHKLRVQIMWMITFGPPTLGTLLSSLSKRQTLKSLGHPASNFRREHEALTIKVQLHYIKTL